MKNILKINDLTKNEIVEILQLSEKLVESSTDILKNKNILFAFEKPSLRTKIGTECAINQLGGSVVHIEPENFFGGQILFSNNDKYNLSGRESLKDTVKNICGFCDAIFARVNYHQTLIEIAYHSTIPVVNALCDIHHPMQALADLLTINQKFGDEKISLAFVGDANNVAYSLFEVLLLFGHDISFAGPKEYYFTGNQQYYFNDLASKYGGKMTFTHDPAEAVKGVDVIYTDTFVSMGEEAEYDKKMKYFADFQVNDKLISYTGKDTYFMHCLPAHRDVEVTNKVIDDKNSLVYTQSKNRMIVSKGVFASLVI